MAESNDEGGVRFGPVQLAPGISRWNASTYLFSAFWTIGFLSFISFIQPYILEHNLGLPAAEQGRAVGTLSFSGEIVVLLLSPFFGALSDRIGRRPIYALGFTWIGVGFALYPLATSLGMLIAIRMFFAVGTAMLGGMMATVLADYPANRSRGFMGAMSGWANGLGALTTIFLLSQLPRLFSPMTGGDDIAAGRFTFWTVSILCLIVTLVVFKGLKPGKPGRPKARVPFTQLMRQGALAARDNPRIFLA